MTGAFRIRRANLRDLPLLVRHRRAMWEAILSSHESKLRPFDRKYRRWLRLRMRGHQVLAFVATDGRGSCVGSLVLWFRETEPGPSLPHGRAPFLSTVFVEPSFRRNGLASSMIRLAIAECRSRKYPFVTAVPVRRARSLLRRQGFGPLGEMGLVLGGRVW